MGTQFKEQNRLIDRPTKIDIYDKFVDLYNELDELTQQNEFINLEDCYDNIQHCPTIKNSAIVSTNLQDTQVIEALMKLCYKYKNPIRVLSIINEENSFDLFS